MNIFSNKFILAAAAALVVFTSGCVKKPSRPTPEMTAVYGDGSATSSHTSTSTTTSTDTNAWSNANTSGSAYSAGSFGGGQVTTAPVDVVPTGQNVGTPDANGEIRNVAELQPIYFGFDRSAIDRSERSKFDAIKAYLAKNPGYKIIFEGHCDWRGTAEYNMALGDRRANSSKRYATGIGIDPSKILVRSKGSTEATERGSDDVMAKDRRAEIIVLVK